MNKPDRIAIERLAAQLRREEIARLLKISIAALTDWLRQRHENALRRRPRSARMRSANATPV